MQHANPLNFTIEPPTQLLFHLFSLALNVFARQKRMQQWCLEKKWAAVPRRPGRGAERKCKLVPRARNNQRLARVESRKENDPRARVAEKGKFIRVGNRLLPPFVASARELA